MNKLSIFILVLTSLLLVSCSEQSRESAARPTAKPEAPYQLGTIHIESLKQGWSSTGLILNPGDETTISADGQIELGLPHPLEPKHALWGRVGESGTIFQLASNQYSFTSSDSGELFIAMSPSGLLWANRQGDWAEPFSQMPDAPLDISVEAFLWAGSAKDGLNQMGEDPSRRTLAENSLKAISDVKPLPEGYDYL